MSPTARFRGKKGTQREVKFPLSVTMVRHAGRNWALLGGNAFPLTPGLIYGLTLYRWRAVNFSL